MRLSVTTLVTIAVVVTACAEPGGQGPAADPTTVAWELESGTLDGEPIPIVDGHPVTLSFTEGNAGGVSACNRYFGNYTLSGNELSFDSLGGTEMACMPEEVMESEARYLAALSRVTGFSMSDGRLTLTGDGVEMAFVELPPVPTEALIGTLWILDGLVRGDAVSSVMGDPATLLLTADGSMQGSTGCRSLNGRYTIDGAEVLLTDLAADGECPSELQEQDDLVVTVLGDGFRAAIDGNILTLSSVGNEGLIYRAEG